MMALRHASMASFGEAAWRRRAGASSQRAVVPATGRTTAVQTGYSYMYRKDSLDDCGFDRVRVERNQTQKRPYDRITRG
jgi:hypothetical protein